MRRRLAVVFSALLFVLGLGAASATGAMAGTSAPAPRHAVTHAAPAQLRPDTVADAVCADTGSGPCLNRDGCRGIGTAVLAWTKDFDNCEDFKPMSLSTMCGHGTVTSTCPFAVGSGLNNRYVGSIIVAFKSTSTGGCLADDGYSFGVLGSCPLPSGSGGSYGTIYIWNSAHYTVSREWSNYNYDHGKSNAPAWMCVTYEGDQVETDVAIGEAGQCQWLYVANG